MAQNAKGFTAADLGFPVSQVFGAAPTPVGPGELDVTNPATDQGPDPFMGFSQIISPEDFAFIKVQSDEPTYLETEAAYYRDGSDADRMIMFGKAGHRGAKTALGYGCLRHKRDCPVGRDAHADLAQLAESYPPAAMAYADAVEHGYGVSRASPEIAAKWRAHALEKDPNVSPFVMAPEQTTDFTKVSAQIAKLRAAQTTLSGIGYPITLESGKVIRAYTNSALPDASDAAFACLNPLTETGDAALQAATSHQVKGEGLPAQSKAAWIVELNRLVVEGRRINAASQRAVALLLDPSLNGGFADFGIEMEEAGRLRDSGAITAPDVSVCLEAFSEGGDFN